MRLGGTTTVAGCSFLSNIAYTRGLAVAVVGSANITGSSFDGNQLSCADGSYRSDTEEVKTERLFFLPVVVLGVFAFFLQLLLWLRIATHEPRLFGPVFFSVMHAAVSKPEVSAAAYWVTTINKIGGLSREELEPPSLFNPR